MLFESLALEAITAVEKHFVTQRILTKSLKCKKQVTGSHSVLKRYAKYNFLAISLTPASITAAEKHTITKESLEPEM